MNETKKAPVYKCVQCGGKRCSKRNQICDVCVDSKFVVPEYCICGKELTEENTVHCKNADGQEYKCCDECRRLFDYRFDETRGAYCND